MLKIKFKNEVVELFRVNLTKGVLFSLRAENFIVSNACTDDRRPVIATRVDAYGTRDELWSELKRKNLSGRLFNVYQR